MCTLQIQTPAKPEGSLQKSLQIDAAACRGCGLCATGCSEGAVEMVGRETNG